MEISPNNKKPFLAQAIKKSTFVGNAIPGKSEFLIDLV
jgi:hypothetical protein